MIPGAKVNLSGTDLTIAPLNLRQVQELQPKIEAIGPLGIGMTTDQMSTIIDIIHAAVSRNNPEITRDSMADMIDLGNITDAVNAVMGISGLTRGEAVAGSR